MRIVVRIFDRNGLRRAFFFLLAGGTGFALYLCISNAMHYLIHVGETPSAIVGALLPVLPTFWMQRRFTFNSNYPKRKAFPRYVILQVANAVLIGGLTALGKHLGMPAAAVFFVAGIVGTLVSYVVQAKLVFPVR